uniref:Uncharacterized protein n=1 Tax=Romanomermis culicivorax TaxID=13658 RepID=A0A915KC01_ROMCU
MFIYLIGIISYSGRSLKIMHEGWENILNVATEMEMEHAFNSCLVDVCNLFLEVLIELFCTNGVVVVWSCEEVEGGKDTK